MPRPKLHSDTTILDATRTVLKRVGPSDLTLSDVAAEVGISRAALIQRFQNRDNLLRCAMTRNVELTDAYLRDIPCDAGADGLDKFFQQLCKVLGSGDQYEVNVLIMWHETQDPVLRELALRRQHLVQDAIEQRLPDKLRNQSLSALLHAVLSGAVMQWVLCRTGRLDDYVLGQLRQAIGLVFGSTVPASPPP